MCICVVGIAAKQDYTDKDIIDFLTNVECLEGLFDTWGTFGRGFINNLELGGPTPIGAQKVPHQCCRHHPTFAQNGLAIYLYNLLHIWHT